jgi:hypothetical protein
MMLLRPLPEPLPGSMRRQTRGVASLNPGLRLLRSQENINPEGLL